MNASVANGMFPAAPGLDSGSITQGSVFKYVMGLVVSSEVQLREMKKQFAKMFAEMADDAPAVPTVGEFSRALLAEQMDSSELRESTKKSKEYQIRRNLIPAFEHIPLDKFGNADWNKWIRETKENPLDWRITRYFNARKVLNEIFNAALARGLIERKPKLDNPDERRNTGRVLTQKEVWWILRNTTYPIFRLFFYTLYKMGCRPREILRWERSMLRTTPNGKLWVDIPARITKTGTARQIPVNPIAAKHILRMMKENPNTRFVFQSRIHPDSPQLSYHGAWKTACDKVSRKHPDFKKTVPYDMRRTKITEELIAGCQPVYLAKLLGTSVPMLENVYAKDDAATLEALVE